MNKNQFAILAGILVVGLAVIAGILAYRTPKEIVPARSDKNVVTPPIVDSSKSKDDESDNSGLDVVLWDASATDDGRPPNFADFYVTPSSVSNPAAPNFASNPAYANFRTAITNGAKNGPNAAGHYTLVSWGCGTSCQNSVAVDSLTGEIIALPGTSSGIQGKLDSSLLIANPEAWPEQGIWPAYYVLANGKLTLIYAQP